MDLSYPPNTDELRARVRQLIEREVPGDSAHLSAMTQREWEAFLASWRGVLAANALLGLSWPTTYGGAGLGLVEQMVVNEELIGAGLPVYPSPNDSFGLTLLGPTLVHWGTDDQRERFLRPTLTGEVRWAQGYSEPEAGSDLFNLRTTATIDDDRGVLVINGQKTWSTAALTANWIFAPVRTDPATRGAKGLSFVLIPLDQPGVEVRGIENLTGETEFAEIFLDDAIASLDDVVGGLGNGAKVTLTLLGYERGSTGMAAALGHRVELDRLTELIAVRGRVGDSDIQRRLDHCRSQVHALYCLALRAVVQGSRGEELGPQSSLVKLFAAEYHQSVTTLALDVLGSEAATPSGRSTVDALRPQPRWLDPLSSRAWVEDFLNARARTIYGGASEIQRNTIAEQILGLPREGRPAAGAR